jgi:hypothetical protein
MASITIVSGGAQPVFATDVLNGNPAQSASLAGIPINLAGPKLDFYRYVAANTMNTQGQVNGYVSNVLQALQQVTTVAVYQVDGVALSVGIYDTGSFANNTVALAAVTSADQAGVNTMSSVTNVGFKLTT